MLINLFKKFQAPMMNELNVVKFYCEFNIVYDFLQKSRVNYLIKSVC